MKFFYPISHYQKNSRQLLFPLLRAFIRNKPINYEELFELYNIKKGDFQFVNSIEDADTVILTMAWNYYVETKQMHLAEALILEAASQKKTVWTVNLGDLGVIVPDYKNIIVFRLSGKCSFLPNYHVGMPAFISNPDIITQEKSFILRVYQQRPVVGFCGQADKSIYIILLTIAKIGVKNLRSFLGLSKNDKQTFVAASSLRFDMLKKLKISDKITDNFILRKKYRAGAITEVDRKRTAIEFYDNIKNSDYVLCVRGAGNFSIRFYETLAMGRIPLYIHTDGFLPLESSIDWKSHVVWVDYENRESIADVVTKFHENLTAESFATLQNSNYELWSTKLTMGGFYRSFS